MFVRSLIREEEPHARTYRLRFERDVADYLNNVMALVVDLEISPRAEWVVAIMSDPARTSNSKLHDLYSAVSRCYDSRTR